MAGCLSSSMFIGAGEQDTARDVVINCDEEVSCFDADIKSDDLKNTTNITIICNAANACNGMDIDLVHFHSLSIFCAHYEGCKVM